MKTPTDRQLNLACSVAMKLKPAANPKPDTQSDKYVWVMDRNGLIPTIYNPARNKAQALDLIEAFDLFVNPTADKKLWSVVKDDFCKAEHEELTVAIAWCVGKMGDVALR